MQQNYLEILDINLRQQLVFDILIITYLRRKEEDAMFVKFYGKIMFLTAIK